MAWALFYGGIALVIIATVYATYITYKNEPEA